MKSLLPILFAVLAGVFTTIETGINAKLGKIMTPNMATLHNLVTGVIFVLLINLFKGTLYQYKPIIYVSPQWLIGGIFGALIVYFATKSVPELGISKALTIIVAAQLISSLFIDLAVLGKQQLDWYKLSGIGLLLVGTYFIIR